MPRTIPSFRKALYGPLAATLILVSPGTVFAFDATAAVERFKAFVAAQGQTFTYEGIEEATGDSFTLKGASLVLPEMKQPIRAAVVRFSGVSETAAGVDHRLDDFPNN